jgi:predicted HTH transcriptional regulator
MGNLEFIEAEEDYFQTINYQTCNFFYTTATSENFLKNVTGLANLNGGSCWIGLSSATKIKGCDAISEIKFITDIIKPLEIKFIIKKFITKNKQLLQVEIIPSLNKISFNKVYYIADNSICIEANKIILNCWKKSKNETSFFFKLAPSLQDLILNTLKETSKFTLSKAYTLFSLSKSEVDKIISELYQLNKLKLTLENNSINFNYLEIDEIR